MVNSAIRNRISVALAVMMVLTLIPVPRAKAAGLVLELEKTPNLFSDTNLVPGSSITRWVKVKNESGYDIKTGIKATNTKDEGGLGKVLDFKITNGSDTTVYEDTLAGFFHEKDYTPLSDLNNGAEAKYYLTISLKSDAGKEHQGKTVYFDFIVKGDAKDENSDGPTVFISSSDGGGLLPPGLIISEENVLIINITQTSATVEWTTNNPSTSQVIYAAEGESYNYNYNNPPFYGYPHAQPVPEDSNPVTNHSVDLVELTPNTTYYLRVVSHASPATISKQYSFKTLPEEPEEPTDNNQGEPNEDQTPPGPTGGNPPETLAGSVLGTGDEGTGEGQGEGEGETLGESIASLAVAAGADGGSFWSNYWWLILLGLALLLTIFFFLWKRRKDEEEQNTFQPPAASA